MDSSLINRHWTSCWVLMLVISAHWFGADRIGNAAAQETSPREYRVYPLTHKSAEEAERLLAVSLPELGEPAHVVADKKANQILVQGSERAQQLARQLLDSMEKSSPAPSTRSDSAKESASAAELTVRLVNVRARDLEALLQKTLGARWESIPATPRNARSAYRVQNAGGVASELAFDERGNAVIVKGPAEITRQLARLVQAFDTPGATRDRTTRVIPFRAADPVKVKQALDAYLGQGVAESPGEPDEAAAPARPESLRSKPSGNSQSARPRSGIALVGYIFEEVAGESAPPAAAPAAPGDENARQEQLRSLGMDVNVETLPDLDIVILRGRDRDVEELAKIIDELERLSTEAEPEIVVFPLHHVRGAALSRVIAQVTRDLVGSRQGRVSVIPLEKPNSLLLIGWGEALTTMKKLIRKLDQPVGAETQLQVFVLEHARAAPLATLLEQFFANRQGLGAQLTVAADPRSDSLIVQAAPRDMEEVALLIKRLDVEPDEVNQAKIFKLGNALAADVAETLRAAITAAGRGTDAQRSGILEFLSVSGENEKLIRSGLLTSVEVTPNPRNNSLLVTAPAESMELLAALIDQLDTEVAVAQIKVFRVINGDANTMVQMLRSMFPAETGVGQGPALSGAEGETSLVPLRFSVDTRSNSIIATGSEGDLKIIEALLLRLDERGLNDRQNKVYRLKNAPAIDVANAINEFLRNERVVQQAAPGVESPFEQIEREVVVVPEPISNSLILSSTPRFFDEIELLINKLDEEPPQVMIQVLIAEVKLDNAHEFGIETGLQDSVLFDRSLLGNLLTTTNTQQFSTPSGILTATDETIQAANNTPGFDFNNPAAGLPNSGSERSLTTANSIAPQSLTNFSMGRINNELGFGGLVLAASSESVSLLIRALQESRRAEILSRPQIRTLDNQPAYIQIGERVPRVIQSTITTGGTITNSIDLENVGLILGVTPRISPEGMVVMEVDAEKSELGADSEGVPISISATGNIIRAPIVRTTVAQATVSALDGETIVLGGLISKTTTSVERKVPYLADIPLVGQLFRYDSETKQKKELLIILTPYVIRTPEDGDRIKQLETSRISWCCADVHAIHGVSGLCNVTDCPTCAAEIPALYPDFDPRGIRPNATPTPANQSGMQFEPVPVPSPSAAQPSRGSLPAAGPNVPPPPAPGMFAPSPSDTAAGQPDSRASQPGPSRMTPALTPPPIPPPTPPQAIPPQAAGSPVPP